VTGPHDLFCDVCGGAKEALFGCETCSQSIHASCMTRAPGFDEVPEFWFCPHCTDNGFNIPSSAFPAASKPVATIEAMNFDPFISSNPSKSVSDFTEVSKIGRARTTHGYPTPPTPIIPIIDQSTLQAAPSKFQSVSQSSVDNSADVKDATNPHKRGRSSNSKPGVKKKSKYSVYSSEVDKALSVIHSELELAAEVRSSETELQDKIKSLEQQLKLQDVQMVLVKRELELSRRALDVEKFKVNRLTQSQGRVEIAQPNVEVAKLKEQLAKRDEELVAWKEKLKALVG